MGDIDQDNQFQPNQMHDDPDINVALRSRAEDKANHEDSRTCHTRSTEWTDEEKQRLIQLDREERQKGKGFMKRINPSCTKGGGGRKRPPLGFSSVVFAKGMILKRNFG